MDFMCMKIFNDSLNFLLLKILYNVIVIYDVLYEVIYYEIFEFFLD